MGSGRILGSKNKITRPRICSKCRVDLVVGVNNNKGQSYCKPCKSQLSKQWKLDNEDHIKRQRFITNRSEGMGVYQVLLNSMCVYVGQGQLRSRRKSHLDTNNGHMSRVVKYCDKHNINRKLLSFNVLEYEGDEQRRLELEDWYITFLTPLINPKPTLGLYV
tara:strand:- start:171 stop:656 length:486 start_codon:yes stop_codon:yes gene_type:complete